MTADDVYSNVPIFEEHRTKYIEYLCMRLIELEDKKLQQNVLYNYIRLVENLRLKYRAFDKQKVEVQTENIVAGKQNFLQNIVSVFNLTDTQKDYFIKQGRDMLTMFYDNIVEKFYDNIVENNLK